VERKRGRDREEEKERAPLKSANTTLLLYRITYVGPFLFLFAAVGKLSHFLAIVRYKATDRGKSSDLCGGDSIRRL